MLLEAVEFAVFELSEEVLLFVQVLSLQLVFWFVFEVWFELSALFVELAISWVAHLLRMPAGGFVRRTGNSRTVFSHSRQTTPHCSVRDRAVPVDFEPGKRMPAASLSTQTGRLPCSPHRVEHNRHRLRGSGKWGCEDRLDFDLTEKLAPGLAR